MRSRAKGHRRPETESELNLIPVMNLFVCLIPFLLMAAAFTQMGAVDAETPSRSDGSETAQESREQTLDLIVQVDSDFVRINGFTNSFSHKVEELSANFSITDVDGLKLGLEEILETHPEIHSTLFRVGGDTAYDSAIQVLAQLRQMSGLGKLILATQVVQP